MRLPQRHQQKRRSARWHNKLYPLLPFLLFHVAVATRRRSCSSYKSSTAVTKAVKAEVAEVASGGVQWPRRLRAVAAVAVNISDPSAAGQLRELQLLEARTIRRVMLVSSNPPPQFVFHVVLSPVPFLSISPSFSVDSIPHSSHLLSHDTARLRPARRMRIPTPSSPSNRNSIPNSSSVF